MNRIFFIFDDVVLEVAFPKISEKSPHIIDPYLF